MREQVFHRGVAEAAPALAMATGWARRLEAGGVAGLTESETLELILARCLPPGRDPGGAAAALLARFGCIGRVVGATRADLARVVGAPAAEALMLLHALLVRSLEHPLRRRSVLSSSSAVTTYLRAQLAAAPREAVHVLFLDKANQLIADERMGVGTVDHAPVYPREILRRALELSASALCLVHNHPTGGATPSAADIEMTKAVVQAGRALGVVVHDHWLVAGDQVVSFRGLGLI
jgi:DNA repair protein RadC